MACVPCNNVSMRGGDLCGLCLWWWMCGCVGRVMFGFGVNPVMR